MSISTSVKSCIPNSLKRCVKLTSRNIISSLRYYLVDGALFSREKYWNHVIFVCKGNVCRSAFAEYRLRGIVGAEKAIIESCGLDVDQGKYPPVETIRCARNFFCDMTDHVSKGVNECDFANADLILSMEYGQHARLTALFPKEKDKIQLLRSYAPFPYALFCNIDDPYGWGDTCVVQSFTVIDRALKILATRYVK